MYMAQALSSVIYQTTIILETKKKKFLGKDCSLEFKSISSPPEETFCLDTSNQDNRELFSFFPN